MTAESTESNSLHHDLAHFYRDRFDRGSSLFDIWEEGGADGDSITPATYHPGYRYWMGELLTGALGKRGGGLLSLGCGNGAVEADIARAGFPVLAVDAMPEAVELTRRKGVPAVCADLFRWEPDAPWTVLYLDGLLGHLHSPEHGLRPVFDRVRGWCASGGATLIASNDSPRDGGDVQAAPGVDGFRWLSAEYMRRQALESGFDAVSTAQFRYQRPLSGERVRAVVTCHVTP
ncbi:methyltransferase domain-containing protein [Saccharopolyspora sp. MS10]|uniref:methyltransferase domain-containing protein n=1 Tax=Saccharopolyspora sp. MS10 TaxID=3385973 RepID=UPI0039A3D593